MEGVHTRVCCQNSDWRIFPISGINSNKYRSLAMNIHCIIIMHKQGCIFEEKPLFIKSTSEYLDVVDDVVGC